jgi:hypothetical protein
MPQITSFGEAVLVSVTAALVAILSFLPALAGAIILLIIGWFLADLVARLVGTLLRRLGFETVARRTGVTGFIHLTGAKDASASMVLAELIKWFIRLIFIELAAEALHLSAVTGLINSIVLFIPNLVVALVVVMIGALIANFAANVVRGGAGEMGFRNPNLLATLARYAILTFAVLIALHQVGIASTLVDTLFMAIVGAIALAAGLAFGLGGRDVAAQLWKQWYETGRGATAKLEERAATTQQGQEQAAARQMSYESIPPAPVAPYQVRHERREG